jgi:hypothetical protein
MGEYFQAISLTEQEYLSPYDYDNGAKIGEHAYILNDFVRSVCYLLMEGQRWHMNRIAWVGDYAEGVIFSECKECFEKKINESCPHFIRKVVGECHLKDWKTVYGQTRNIFISAPTLKELPHEYFIVNHSREEYIDCGRIFRLFDEDWVPHPLPHKTKTPDGDWLRDVLSVTIERPKEFEEDEYNIHEYGGYRK